ncbi:MAG: hypothetical protein OEY51_13980, partial [Cyclobacteriaceae bacterium]|nr:hypothetical protein [Cyclobacteriaceae bacterium]
LSHDGKRLFAVDQINFRLLVIDVEKRVVEQAVSTGRYPFGIALSPDETKVYVANVGMYEYQLIPGITMENAVAKAIKFPAFAYGSEEAARGTVIDSLEIPGLGEQNAPESFSVWVFNVADEKPINTARIKTGNLVGEKVEGIPAVGGASPNSIAVTDNFVFVTNGNNDNISVIDIDKDTIVNHLFLKLHPAVKHFRGVIPFGVAVSPDQRRLYVAESGINAVGVVDIPSMKVIGHIPTGWFPSKLEVTPDGKKLVVANAKGYGSGPNGGRDYKRGPEGTYIGSLMKGTVTVFDIPSDEELAQLTEKVVSNNFLIQKEDDPALRWRKGNPVPLYGGESESPIKHIVFISKENRTYDEIFGQVKGGKGDPTLARFGYKASVKNRSKTDSLNNVDVMPNHLKLAKEFALGDNFYVDSDHSADGHRWLVNTYPNEWTETTTAANYGGNRNFSLHLKAPGRFAFNGSAGAIFPEDYNEAGSMWEHMERNEVSFYNFGFGVMFEPAIYDPTYKNSGIAFYTNYPMPAPIYDKTSKKYPTYNMGIPDQFRVDRFIEEFNEKWIGSQTPMPEMLTVIIPNDHGADERPDDGYPYVASYQADNDLALGRIVEFLSHTPYWEKMLIIVTEDDAQGGVDHVDAHRSVLLMISPYVKRGYIGKQHYSFGSLFKTFWNILGTPYLNQYDAGATDLADFMTSEADFTPYSAVPVAVELF